MGQHTGIIKVPVTTLINSPSSLNHFNNLAEVRNILVSFSAIPFLAKKKQQQQQLLLFIIQALVKAKCKG